eukprot:UN10890
MVKEDIPLPHTHTHIFFSFSFPSFFENFIILPDPFLFPFSLYHQQSSFFLSSLISMNFYFVVFHTFHNSSPLLIQICCRNICLRCNAILSQLSFVFGYPPFFPFLFINKQQKKGNEI